MRKPTIICVDDEKIVLTSLKSELKETFGNDYFIETADGGEDALEIVEELRADRCDIPVVIADYIMPGIKGDELLKRIHEKMPKTLKIMLTGQADSQAVGNAVNYAKLYRYIAKPWDREDLALTVTEAARAFFQAKTIEEQNEELREMNRTLEQKVDERTKELSEALDGLKAAQGQLVQSAKMASLGKLTAGIAHEVNNPIGAIKSSADVADRCVSKIIAAGEDSKTLEEFKDGHPFLKSTKMLKDSMQNILYASDRIEAIVDSLKNFAHLDEAEVQIVNLHEGIESTLALIQHEIRDGVEIVKEFGTLPQLKCCPGEVNQVFMTILTNAVQAIDKSGKVSIKTVHEGGEISIAISDTGKGIPEEQLQTLFDLDFTTKGARVGMGMGLPSAYNIIKKHRGELKVQSKVGQGTSFVITLPVL